MSSTGQPGSGALSLLDVLALGDPLGPGVRPAVLVGTFPMAPGGRFDRHSHPRHQLAWAADGVLIVIADAGTWVLPPSRALWIPAEVPHETVACGRTTMRTLYLTPQTRPAATAAWEEPCPVRVTPLLAHLIEHLESRDLAPGRRERAEAVLLDLLEPVHTTIIEAPLPDDPRALDVARGLMADPTDGRTLEEWGREVGASARTLARAFARDTGIPFRRWRTAVRLRASLPRLAAGESVQQVAGAVGFQTASAFVAAFRRQTGLTPGAYFRAPGGGAP